MKFAHNNKCQQIHWSLHKTKQVNWSVLERKFMTFADVFDLAFAISTGVECFLKKIPINV